MLPVHRYIEQFIRPENHILNEIYDKEQQRIDIQPSVGPQVGRMLSLLCRLTSAKRVLELGTSVGYSAIWLAEALKETNGRLISVDNHPRTSQEAAENIQRAGVTAYVEQVFGDIRQVLPSLKGPFDLVLQDCEKALYPDMLESCIQVTRLNGIIAADDTLFKPLGKGKKFGDYMHKYNERVFADSRLYSTILPIGDGLTLSVKISE